MINTGLMERPNRLTDRPPERLAAILGRDVLR